MLWPHRWHMEVPGPGTEPEPQLSPVALNPLPLGGNWTCTSAVPSCCGGALNPLCHGGNSHLYLRNRPQGNSLVAVVVVVVVVLPGIKDLALSLQWLGLLLWCRFNPWPRNFHLPQEHPTTTKKIKRLHMKSCKTLSDKGHVLEYIKSIYNSIIRQ